MLILQRAHNDKLYNYDDNQLDLSKTIITFWIDNMSDIEVSRRLFLNWYYELEYVASLK